MGDDMFKGSHRDTYDRSDLQRLAYVTWLLMKDKAQVLVRYSSLYVQQPVHKLCMYVHNTNMQPCD